MENSPAMLVCVHKNGFFYSGKGYLPIHCGRAISSCQLSIFGDDSGDNISDKNGNYCELTAQYWAWKNMQSDFVGLSHYRRYFDFSGKKRFLCNQTVISEADFNHRFCHRHDWKNLLNGCDLILPISDIHSVSVEQDYALHYNSEDWRILRRVIEDISPDYLTAFNQVSMQNYFSHYNMFLMPRALFNQYCTWLFFVLAEVEKRTFIEHYSIEQKRIYGFMSERLLNVFVKKQQLRVHYYPIFKVDNQEQDESLCKRMYAKGKAHLSFFLLRPHFHLAEKGLYDENSL